MLKNLRSEWPNIVATFQATVSPLYLALYIIRLIHNAHRSRLTQATSTYLERWENNAQTKAAIDYITRNATLSQDVTFTLAVPTDHDYPSAIPVAPLTPMQDTTHPVLVITVFYAMPALPTHEQEATPPVKKTRKPRTPRSASPKPAPRTKTTKKAAPKTAPRTTTPAPKRTRKTRQEQAS